MRYAVTAHLSAYAYYGHAFGQDVVRASFADAQLDYAYVEVTLSF